MLDVINEIQGTHLKPEDIRGITKNDEYIIYLDMEGTLWEVDTVKRRYRHSTGTLPYIWTDWMPELKGEVQ